VFLARSSAVSGGLTGWARNIGCYLDLSLAIGVE
jgi:hypothetical protein